MTIPMKLTATWINAVGDQREVDGRQRLYVHELLKQVESVEALRCMHNQAINYPNTHHRYWAITAAALARTFGDKPNRDGSVFGNMMKLNFNMGNE